MQLLSDDLASARTSAAWHLVARVELLGEGLAAAVARRRTVDSADDEHFRGLYVSDALVDALLTARPVPLEAGVTAGPVDDVEAEAERMEREGASFPLRRLARVCGLDPADVTLLLVALAPEVDPRFHALYAYLQDNVTRQRAGAGLALELACGPAGPLMQRWRLGHSGALVARHLVRIEDPTAPFSTRPLAVPDRVVGHLLGDDTPDVVVAPAISVVPQVEADPDGELSRAVCAGRAAYVRDRHGGSLAYAAAACRAAGKTSLVIDLARLPAGEDDTDLVAMLAVEATVGGSVIVAGPVEARPRLAALLVDDGVPVVLVGSRPWDATCTARAVLVVEASTPTASERAALWRSCLGSDGDAAASATAQFRLTPEQIAAAAAGALATAAVHGRAPTAEDVLKAARLQSSSGLSRLTTRVEPRAGWDDLVLPDGLVDALRHVAARARYRERVVGEWRMGGPAARQRGVVALLAGASGTGKTLAAEVVARDLGLDLYVVDVSSVVDKYVGETEKNLERIFDEAAQVNGVLLFDEADALFGKRSGVEDAHDRYANVEVAYLLQRIETFDGVALLTSNLRGNLDDAFARRLDAVVEIPMPDEAARLRLWQANLPAELPRGEALDLPFLARFELSGGNVRNACVAAAYRAAARDRPVAMEDLARGVAQEYSKLGRMCLRAEFEPYYELVAKA